jgi:alkylation response protein AidB-like acyl-CoA dehydrogenase
LRTFAGITAAPTNVSRFNKLKGYFSDNLDESALGWPTRELLAQVAAQVPRFQQTAPALDAVKAFPRFELDELRAAGALGAVTPVRFGGLGLGVEPLGADGAFELLRLIGRGNLALGRIFEGHMNALNLIANYGEEAQIARAAEDARAGHLFAIWNTERPSDPLHLMNCPAGLVLGGCKSFCSAAGHATRGLITATNAGGASQMVLICLQPNDRVESIEFTTQGMRAAATGRIRFDGMEVEPRDFIGSPGDYLREPAFSGGAWRTCAVILGGVEALIEASRIQLIERKRDQDPFQQARMGRAFIACETIRLWTRRAASIAESKEMEVERTTSYVNLTRTAVEAATLETIRLVQRSIGLAAFLQPSLIERLLRDLSTYLRQPAPDEALTEAAGQFLQSGLALLE